MTEPEIVAKRCKKCGVWASVGRPHVCGEVQPKPVKRRDRHQKIQLPPPPQEPTREQVLNEELQKRAAAQLVALGMDVVTAAAVTMGAKFLVKQLFRRM